MYFIKMIIYILKTKITEFNNLIVNELYQKKSIIITLFNLTEKIIDLSAILNKIKKANYK